MVMISFDGTLPQALPANGWCARAHRGGEGHYTDSNLCHGYAKTVNIRTFKNEDRQTQWNLTAYSEIYFVFICINMVAYFLSSFAQL